MIELLRYFISWGALILAFIPVFYILVITLAALKTVHKNRSYNDQTKIAVVIPAHNEKLLISQTVKSVLKQDYPEHLFSIFVIADNCSDDTADLARAAGATVFERSEDPGKGQALNDVFSKLLKEDWQAFLVIDADSDLQGKALKAINCEFSEGEEVLQLIHSTVNPNVNNRTRSMQLAMASFNALRPQGRTALGLSCGLYGNGFCLSRSVLQKLPYLAHSIVEDLEYHIFLLKNGYKVKFVNDGISAAQAPIATTDSEIQRTRWEIGKILTIRKYLPEILMSMFKRKRWAWEAFSEMMMPPSSLIVLFCLIPLIFGFSLERWISLSLLMTMGLHYVIASIYYGSFINFVRICFYIPWYIVWKTVVVLKSISGMNSLSWVRTERHESESSKDSNEKQ